MALDHPLWTDLSGWWIDRRFERRFRQGRKSQPGIFLGWNHVDLFDLPPLARRRLFLAVPSWWAAYEPSSILNVPSPLVFQYFYHHGLSAPPELARKLEAYALAEFVVWTLICFLDTARAEVPLHEDRDDRLDHPPEGAILFSLPPRTVSILELYVVDKVIDRVCSEPAHGLAAYELPCGV